MLFKTSLSDDIRLAGIQGDLKTLLVVPLLTEDLQVLALIYTEHSFELFVLVDDFSLAWQRREESVKVIICAPMKVKFLLLDSDTHFQCGE